MTKESTLQLFDLVSIVQRLSNQCVTAFLINTKGIVWKKNWKVYFLCGMSPLMVCSISVSQTDSGADQSTHSGGLV